jgi:hypothetical protein
MLFDSLFDSGYEIINFPGSILNKDRYIRWHRERRSGHGLNQTTCEGVGVTLRLASAHSPAVRSLVEFIHSDSFKSAISNKLSVDSQGLRFDAGLQKYLDGYEISPHPDVRDKALTFMININPSPDAVDQEHHTSLLRFRKEYQYVEAYWRGHPLEDRCWVPWDWCDAVRVHNQNNSLIAFAPSDDTMHAVRARYDHLRYQRTQLYGNFWRKSSSVDSGPSWIDFSIGKTSREPTNFRGKLGRLLPSTLRKFATSILYRRSRVNDDRLK